MKKFSFLIFFIAVLVVSCSRNESLMTDQNGDRALNNPYLKCASIGEITVTPSGTDDSQSLLDAFAAASGKHAVVKLVPGTYIIGMIEVKDFNGTLSGSGKGKTIITSLPDLSPDALIALNKLPALITFIGGDVTVTDLTVKLSDAFPWLGTNEMSLLQFSDFSADYMPSRQHIKVTLDNIDVTGILQRDVMQWDGAVVDFPFSGFNGTRFSPDIYTSGGTPITRSNIDINISNSFFSKFSRGIYVFGLKSGNLNFGAKGGNKFSYDYSGLSINENVGTTVKIIDNEFNVPNYFWDGIDINTTESLTFEYVHTGNMACDIRSNTLNLDNSEGIGIWDDWRYEHPDNPAWIQLRVENNSFNGSAFGECMGLNFALKDAVFSGNTVTGPEGSGWIGNFGTYWITTDDPNYLLTVSENCKFLNNRFLQKGFYFYMEWDTKDYLIMGDLTNVSFGDNGTNNKVISKDNPGHSNGRPSRFNYERIEKAGKMYHGERDHNRH